MNFFAPRGEGKACGMFTLPHLIALTICIILIIIGINKTVGLEKKKVIRIIKIVFFIVLLLEVIKIGYNFYYGYNSLDNWVPL